MIQEHTQSRHIINAMVVIRRIGKCPLECVPMKQYYICSSADPERKKQKNKNINTVVISTLSIYNSKRYKAGG